MPEIYSSKHEVPNKGGVVFEAGHTARFDNKMPGFITDQDIVLIGEAGKEVEYSRLNKDKLVTKAKENRDGLYEIIHLFIQELRQSQSDLNLKLIRRIEERGDPKGALPEMIAKLEPMAKFAQSQINVMQEVVQELTPHITEEYSGDTDVLDLVKELREEILILEDQINQVL